MNPMIFISVPLALFALIFFIYLIFMFRKANKKRNQVKDSGSTLDLGVLDKQIFELIDKKEFIASEAKIDEIIEKFGIGWPDPKRYRYENIRALIYRMRSADDKDPVGMLERALEIYEMNIDHPLLLLEPHKRIDLESDIEHTKLWIVEKKEALKNKTDGGEI